MKSLKEIDIAKWAKIVFGDDSVEEEVEGTTAHIPSDSVKDLEQDANERQETAVVYSESPFKKGLSDKSKSDNKNRVSKKSSRNQSKKLEKEEQQEIEK